MKTKTPAGSITRAQSMKAIDQAAIINATTLSQRSPEEATNDTPIPSSPTSAEASDPVAGRCAVDAGSASELLASWREAMDKRREACVNAPYHSSDWDAMDYQIRFTIEDVKALLVMTGKILERVAELERLESLHHPDTGATAFSSPNIQSSATPNHG